MFTILQIHSVGRLVVSYRKVQRYFELVRLEYPLKLKWKVFQAWKQFCKEKKYKLTWNNQNWRNSHLEVIGSSFNKKFISYN